MAIIDYEFPGTYCLNNGPQDAREAFSRLQAHFKGSSNRASVNGFQLERKTNFFGDAYITVTKDFGGRKEAVFRFSKINHPLTRFPSDYRMESLPWDDLSHYNPTVCESAEGISRTVLRSFATLFNIPLDETMPGSDWHFTGRD